MQRPILFALAAALTFALAAPASANSWRSEVARQRVSYSGIDTTTPAGAELLFYWIRSAARTVCGFQYGPTSLAERFQAKKCVSDIMGRAIADAHNPMLTAAYEGGHSTWVFAAR